jgi:formate hydrogenlyase subunit 4
MILDHGGVDLGFIEYASSLKLWILGSLIVGLAVPVRSGNLGIDLASMLAALIGLAVLIGIIESTKARFRMCKVPQLLVGACVFTIIGFLIQ